ncbi:hypothetical protein K493DRAFT_27708 [Basidiobolus meristosporus CBS 931.73]|uniref:Uncharacterized protein n=1 Tax=Basidiobolus meristosporus CBS 931.73 TaxID=1314790 RepID=A0A1Y1YAC5_9FUNG|nr:hypothetical protein K493DRAFT_27708 [Basidiobolus meristosporus CBS 931.73]|eukprot:ORX94960.1 hypothetical protein K493DRAFT_27708 [Basidiobolus meristosporus CBS 931.73]
MNKLLQIMADVGKQLISCWNFGCGVGCVCCCFRIAGGVGSTLLSGFCCSPILPPPYSAQRSESPFLPGSSVPSPVCGTESSTNNPADRPPAATWPFPSLGRPRPLTPGSSAGRIFGCSMKRSASGIISAGRGS